MSVIIQNKLLFFNISHDKGKTHVTIKVNVSNTYL